MTALATNTVPFSSPSAYTPYMIAPVGAPTAFGALDSFNPWPGVNPPPSISYLQRVWDSGGGLWCYYTKLFVDPAPGPGDTTPPYTGSISAHNVVLVS